jgi:hypothetical protein
MVFIPVRLVTVAEPPRMSMDETMMFVARPAQWDKDRIHQMKVKERTKEHKNAMSEGAPATSDNFEEGMRIRSVKLKLR